jgi:hypothetical protein
MNQESILREVNEASKDGYNPLFEAEDLEEEIQDLKVDFDLVRTEVKEATQEAISKRTIQAYQKYMPLPQT